jgi:hypothetical protein
MIWDGGWSGRRTNWAQLSAEQQERLSALGIKPAERRARGKLSEAFQRGVAALAQYIAREGAGRPVPRSHSERIVINGQEHLIKLGVLLSNTKSRRDRLSEPQRAALAELDVDWA